MSAGRQRMVVEGIQARKDGISGGGMSSVMWMIAFHDCKLSSPEVKEIVAVPRWPY
ncbi:hypothetical protein [Duncaniella dubosii]|uniref:hypothetical protein n=1 Tax=Duncaniella dubosii TaxID=2518971 RepID=UPI003F67826A